MVVFHLIFRIRYTDFSSIEEEFIEQFKNNLLTRIDIDYFNFSIEYFNNCQSIEFHSQANGLGNSYGIEFHFYTFDNFDTNSIGLLIEDLRDCFQQLEIISVINIV